MAAEVESAQAVLNWFVGAFAALFLVLVFERAVTVNTPDAQKHILTSVAVANGMVIGIGLAPMSSIAAELVPLSTLLQSEYVGLVTRIVQVGTALELLFGFGRMFDGSGLFGALAFLGAFVGGVFLPFRKTAGAAIVLIFLGLLAVEAAPSDFWMSR